MNENEAGILHIVRKCYLWNDSTTTDLYVPTEVNLVNNEALVERYMAKKGELRAKVQCLIIII